MCGETGNRKTTDKIPYLYNPGSYDPIARIDCNTKTNQQQIYYFHSQLNGLPEELTDENGRIVWQGNYQLWGKLNQYKPSYYLNNSNPHRLEQNLRFAGQYADNDKFVSNKFKQCHSIGPSGRVSGMRRVNGTAL